MFMYSVSRSRSRAQNNVEAVEIGESKYYILLSWYKARKGNLIYNVINFNGNKQMKTSKYIVIGVLEKDKISSSDRINYLA